MDVHIREMTEADCDAVAEIRVRGWQAAYRGLIPQAHLDAMSVEEDAARRRELWADRNSTVTNLIAERNGTPVGWAAYGPYRTDGPYPNDPRRTADGELYAIYVHPGEYGGGIGQALMAETLTRATAAGYPTLYLWVLTGNARARRFYEHAGFHADGVEEPFEVDGEPVPEMRYAQVVGDLR
ncbi:GNAT family N-acetyltransferase [Streptomyces sp. NBC_01304]|uniref:GNAT family N-acetyltransferase n=1 Tax=Streptomyces sp. NBC_01304 TaxID=2903818 RepID=UPI002E139ABC|nr:GNAT family N-acetyltransferase [Streptomyces sp. NBC_01304]